jgi:6-phosphogluconolactonase (cycloisomerase 2 family)
MAPLASADEQERAVVGAVFVMTNATDPIRGNEVVMYRRQADGTLILHGYFPTGGLGSGPGFVPDLQADPLGSQGALILSKGHPGSLLFAVNAGSDEVSAFQVFDVGLLRVATVSSKTETPSLGHAYPVSLTSHGHLLYVLNADLLNAGANANITGFRVDQFGNLTPLPGSTRSVGTGGPIDAIPNVLRSPAQVQFSPDGDLLIVTVKDLGGPGPIYVFSVDKDGLPSQTPVFTLPGNGAVPFGFTFDARGHLLVTELFGAPQNVPPNPPLPFFNASAVSSYLLRGNRLEVISDSIGNGQTATCWIAVSGSYAYVTNTASNTITGYRIGRDGTLSLIDNDGVTATTNGLLLDIAVSSDGRFLYALQTGTGTIVFWKINEDGSLTFLGDVGGLRPVPETAPEGPFSTEGGSSAGLVVY